MDKEYILMNEIEKNENITQRELSKNTQLSLGSVNILINKMVHEGLVKISQIPMNRVAYMLTPTGIAEKVRKTSGYIKIHYNYINETTQKIKHILLKTIKLNGAICVMLENDEISELVKLAVAEIADKKQIEVIENKDIHGQYLECNDMQFNENKTIITVSIETYDGLSKNHMKVINLLELI